MPAAVPLLPWERRLLRWNIGMWADPQQRWELLGRLCSWQGRSLEEAPWQPTEEELDLLLAALPWVWGILPHGVPPWPQGLRAPERLPPPLLAYRGLNTQLLEGERISILGTRRPKPDEVLRVRRLVQAMAKRPGVVLVTGLRPGVEAIATQEMLTQGGKVLAVAPGPLDRLLPRHEAQVAAIEAAGGLSVSPWPFGAAHTGDAWTWQQRVRAGVANVSILVAAGPGSSAIQQAQLVRAMRQPLYLVRQLVPQPPAWVQAVLASGAEVLELREGERGRQLR